MKKRKITLLSLLAIVVAAAITLSACLGGGASGNYGRIYRPVERSLTQPQTATTLTLPATATNLRFLGGDLLAFDNELATTTVYNIVFDMAANTNIFNGFTSSTPRELLLDVVGCTNTAFYIIIENLAGNFALLNRSGNFVFDFANEDFAPSIEFGSWWGWRSSMWGGGWVFCVDTYFAENWSGFDIEHEDIIELTSHTWRIAQSVAELENILTNEGVPSDRWSIVSQMSWGGGIDFDIRIYHYEVLYRVREIFFNLNAYTICENHLHINGDLFRVDTNGATKIIENITRNIAIFNGIIFDASRSVVFNLDGDIKYIAENISGQDFMPLNNEFGVYIRSIRVPDTASNYTFFDEWSGEKYLQIIETIEFTNNRRREVSFDFYVMAIVPVALMALELPRGTLDAYVDSAQQYSMVIGMPIEHGVINENRIIGGYVDSRLRERAMFEDWIPAIRLTENRTLKFSHNRGATKLLDNRGNLIRLWAYDFSYVAGWNSPQVSICEYMNLIRVRSGSATTDRVFYYNFDGERAIDTRDFCNILAKHGGIMLANRITENAQGNTITSYFTIEQNGNETAFRSNTQNATAANTHFSIYTVREGVILMADITNLNQLFIYSINRNRLMTMSNFNYVEDADIFYGTNFSCRGYVYLTTYDGTRWNVIRIG